MATTPARKTTTPPPRRTSTTSAPPPASNTTNIEDSAEVVERTEGDKVNLTAATPRNDMVTAIVPKAFMLTLDDHTEVHIAAGTQELPHSHATHWFARAQGVKVYEPKA